MKLNETAGGNGKGPSPAQRMYGQIQAVHTQLANAKRMAAHMAKQQIRVPGQPTKAVKLDIPGLVIHLDEAVHFLAGQCLALGAAVKQLQERLDERSGDGKGEIISEARSGGVGPS